MRERQSTNIIFCGQPHLSSQKAAILKLSHEEGNEEGSQHEDEGQEGSIGLHLSIKC